MSKNFTTEEIIDRKKFLIRPIEMVIKRKKQQIKFGDFSFFYTLWIK